jgi:DNA-binding MarR family transcriptional regulator
MAVDGGPASRVACGHSRHREGRAGRRIGKTFDDIATRCNRVFKAQPPKTMAAASAAKLTKTDYETLAEFRHALRKFLSFSETSAKAHGVLPQQYQALLAIEGFPGKKWVTMGELAEHMCVKHHTAVGMVDRMEKLGLVDRHPLPEDRRRVQVALTRKGLLVLEKLYRVHWDELRSSGPKLVASLQKVSARIGKGHAP